MPPKNFSVDGIIPAVGKIIKYKIIINSFFIEIRNKTKGV